jgi:hypothetical protein
MEFPSIFISNAFGNKRFSDSFEVLSINDLNITYQKELKSDLLIINQKDFILFAHINIGCRDKIMESPENIEILMEDYSSITSDLHWGFLLFVNKLTNDVRLVNDIYGIYPIYYQYKNKDFVITNDFDTLIKFQESISFNIYGIYDYFLFNYTLDSRTLIEGISQLRGGSILESQKVGFKIIKYLDPCTLLFPVDIHADIQNMSEALRKHVISDIDPGLPVQFPLTGGFDSKVVLSILINIGIRFSSFTFGNEFSEDNIAAQSIARKYKFSHKFFGISQEFINDIKNHLDTFLRCYPNAPMFDTLLYYTLVKDQIPDSNFVTGQMGGELIVGPVLISELITTRTASLLTLSSNKESLIAGLKEHIHDIGFLQTQKFEEHITNYVLPMLNYMKTNVSFSHKNLINFLLNETYAKFFGVVFCNLITKCNLINPLVDLDFLKIVLNSKYSLTKKKPFSKAPLQHFLSRMLYPRIIKTLDSSVLDAKMDRGYNLYDFLYWYRFPIPFLNYFKRHYFSKKSKKQSTSIKYEDTLKKMASDVLPDSLIMEMGIFDKKYLKDLLQRLVNNKTSTFENKKILQLLMIHYFIQRYPDKLKLN